MERHTVSRLIGAPPGYVGFDQGGLLTDAVRKTPYAVLVLDEIEKAHPDLFNILLQVMDHAHAHRQQRQAQGRLPQRHPDHDHQRRRARDVATRSIGLREGAAASQGQGRGAIERTFSPEFRNRLDAWIAFEPLRFETIERVVDKFVERAARAARREERRRSS